MGEVTTKLTRTLSKQLSRSGKRCERVLAVSCRGGEFALRSVCMVAALRRSVVSQPVCDGQLSVFVPSEGLWAFAPAFPFSVVQAVVVSSFSMWKLLAKDFLTEER